MGPRRIERATETSQERHRGRRALDPVSRCWIIKTKLLCGRRRRLPEKPAGRPTSPRAGYATSSTRAVYILSGM